MQPYDDITKYHYMVSFPTNIFAFVKWDKKETLDLSFVEAFVVEKDLHSIRVIIDSNDSKDSKDAGMKT